MPVLPPGVFLHPAHLFAEPRLPPDESRRWWILSTRPRAEKAVARRLYESGATFFLPTYQKTHRSKGRVFRSYLPLFPGYLFLYADPEGSRHAMETRLVTGRLAVDDQAKLHQELLQVHRLIASGAPLAPEERIVPGTAIEMTQGPLAGLRGRMVRRGKRLRLVVEVRSLGRGVSMDLPASLLAQTVRRELGDEPA